MTDDERYKIKFRLLSAKCECIQKENGLLARQILEVKRNLQKTRRMRLRLMKKLDDCGDPWRQGHLKGEVGQKKQSQSPTITSASTSTSSGPKTGTTSKPTSVYSNKRNTATNNNASSSSSSLASSSTMTLHACNNVDMNSINTINSNKFSLPVGDSNGNNAIIKSTNSNNHSVLKSQLSSPAKSKIADCIEQIALGNTNDFSVNQVLNNAHFASSLSSSITAAEAAAVFHSSLVNVSLPLQLPACSQFSENHIT